MLLAVDVGNTQTALGLYRDGELAEHWRLATERSTTADELGVLLSGLLDFESVAGICLASTVPVLVREWEELARKWAHAPLLVVGPGVKTGIAIRYDDPREVGPDRIVNSVAAKERYGAPVIVVDFGTSTNFDVVSPEGEYVGGVLAPGIESSMDALFARAARLVKVDYSAPETSSARPPSEAFSPGSSTDSPVRWTASSDASGVSSGSTRAPSRPAGWPTWLRRTRTRSSGSIHSSPSKVCGSFGG